MGATASPELAAGRPHVHVRPTPPGPHGHDHRQLSSTKCTSPDTHDPASSPESAYVGAAIQTVPDKADAASPLTYVASAEQLPVFVIAHGDSDCQIPPAQSQTLYDALVARGATATIAILPGAVHADPQFQSTQTTPAIAQLDQAFGR
ncbi:MAG: prolyl oligopeptidase family serine peptidase [Acidimicrobiales bacterium]